MAQLSNVDNVLNNLKYLSTTYAGNMKRLENLLGHYASLFPEEFTDDKAENLKEKFADVILSERRRDLHLKAMESVKIQYRNNERTDFVESFLQKLETSEPNEDVKGDNRFRNFSKKVRDVLSQADPGAQTSNDEEEGTSGEVEGAVGMAGPVRDLSDDEDMVMMDEGPTRLIDPITMKEVVNPVRNKYCKHVYDRDTIIQYIQNSANPKCPFTGCGNKHRLNQNHLLEDEELNRQLMNQRK